jgi:hypothetical protein
MAYRQRRIDLENCVRNDRHNVMYRLCTNIRLFPSSLIIPLNSTNKVPVRNQSVTNDDHANEDDDDVHTLTKVMSPQELIFADSKSLRFREKNPRKQKKWLVELEKRNIVPPTRLSQLMKGNKSTTPDRVKEERPTNQIIR